MEFEIIAGSMTSLALEILELASSGFEVGVRSICYWYHLKTLVIIRYALTQEHLSKKL